MMRCLARAIPDVLAVRDLDKLLLKLRVCSLAVGGRLSLFLSN